MKKSLYISAFGAKKVALLGALIAASLLVFMLENLLPPLFIPGAKLGLSNIFTLFALLALSQSSAIVLLLIRSVLGALLTGSLFSLVYSLTAGIVALILSSFLVRLIPKISLIAVSITAACVHNLVQTVLFCLISGTFAPMVYAPYLILCGVFSGAVVGTAVYFLIHKIPLSYYNKVLDFRKGETIEHS